MAQTKAEKIYEAVGEGYGFNGSKEDALKVINNILLENEVYEKNLLATAQNLIGVIDNKQWKRLESKKWDFQNAIKLFKEHK